MSRHHSAITAVVEGHESPDDPISTSQAGIITQWLHEKNQWIKSTVMRKWGVASLELQHLRSLQGHIKMYRRRIDQARIWKPWRRRAKEQKRVGLLLNAALRRKCLLVVYEVLLPWRVYTKMKKETNIVSSAHLDSRSMDSRSIRSGSMDSETFHRKAAVSVGWSHWGQYTVSMHHRQSLCNHVTVYMYKIQLAKHWKPWRRSVGSNLPQLEATS